MATQIIDPFEQKGSVNIIDPFEKKEETTLEKAFGDLSNADIIAGKKKGDQPTTVIKDPFADTPSSSITINQLKDVWKDELGVTQENKEKLKFLLGDPDKTLLGKVNNYLFDRGSEVIDAAVRTGTSVGFIASGLAGDTLNTIYKVTGNDPSGVGERLTRDINIGLMEIMGRSSGFKPVAKKEGFLKSEKTGKEFDNILNYAKESQENRKEVIQNVNRILDEEIKVIKENNDIVLGDAFQPGNVTKRTQILDEIKSTNEKIAEGIPEIKIEIPKAEVPKVEIPKTEIPKIEIPKVEPIAEPISIADRKPALPLEATKKITDAAAKFFKEENIILDKNKPLSLQIQELWQSGKYDVPTIIRRIAEDNKITYEQFTNFIYPSVRASAQELNAYSQLAKRYKEMLDPTSSFDTGTGTLGFLKRLDNIRKGLLVTRLSTSVRNYVSQTARVGLDVLQSGLDLALQQTIRPFVKDKVKFDKGAVSPLSNFQGLVNNFTQWNPKGGFKKHKEIKTLTNKILENFPKEKDRLFLNYASDVKSASGLANKKGILSKVEGGVDLLNIVNKTQEYITRRAVFLSRLDESIKANGKFYKNKTLEQLTKDGELNLLRSSDIAVAIDKALDTTFAKDFNVSKGGFDAFAGRFIQLINSAPFLLTNIIPFPRFLMNAVKFQYDYSPLGILSFLSKGARAELSRGNTSVLSKASIGTGMILASYALRNQPYAGEKWYEFKVGDRTVDVRPFNPFAAYLFLGDVIKRYQEGTLRNLDVKGIASVLFGIRGTTGVYIVDSLINYFTDPKLDKNSIVSGVQKLLGETAASYLTPFQNFTDVYAQFFPEARAVKETGGSEFTGAFTRRFPGSDLPTLTSPTSYIIDANGIPRAAPIYKQDPLLTQVTGLTFNPAKNPAEKELDRLGFEYREIFRSTKIPELDRAYKDKLAVSIGYKLSNIVETPQYQNMSDSFKSIIIKQSLEKFKKEAKEEMQKDTSLAPYLMQLKINSLDKDTRRIIDDVVGIDYIDNLLKELKKVK